MYGAVAVALVIAVVAVAYGTQAPQLGVAEFAPAARQSMEAPPTTSGSASSAASSRRRATTTTTAPVEPASATSTAEAQSGPATTRAFRTRECFGDPPRQTADPESPPCVAAIFDADNGGATSGGVSATEIRVAMGTNAPTGPSIFAALFDYFNRHYEFYGRRLVPVYTGSPAQDTPANARAAAATIAAQDVFAALPVTTPNPHTSFYQELARQHVVSVVPRGGILLEDRILFDPLHPYVWSVFPSLEDISRNVADLVCSTLAGKHASFAGPGLRDATRKFGVIATGQTTPPWTQPIKDGLAQCGITPVVATLTDANTTDDRRSALNALQQAGVTTVTCLCHVNLALDLNRLGASAVGYRPEWLQVSHTAGDDSFGNFYGSGGLSDLMRVLEITPSEKILPLQARPSYGALMEVAPQLPNPDLYTLQFTYHQLSVLAAGIQGAGPALTPDTFGQALMSTQFSNVGAGAAPYWQPRVGFGPGDHAFFSDYAIGWWNTDVPVYQGTQGLGSWCYLAQGKRFRPGEYPADTVDRFFQPGAPCR